MVRALPACTVPCLTLGSAVTLDTAAQLWLPGLPWRMPENLFAAPHPVVQMGKISPVQEVVPQVT